MPWHKMLIRIVKALLNGKRSRHSSVRSRDSYIGLQGKLTLGIKDRSFGQVMFSNGCTPPMLVQQPAKSMDGTSMPRGTRVLIVDVTPTYVVVVLDPTEESEIEWLR